MTHTLPTRPTPRFALFPQRPRRGSVLLYALALVTMLIAGFALAIDVARIQLAKTELQQAVDAAALHAANSTDGDWQERYRQAIGDNRVRGTVLTEEQVSLETGEWDHWAKQFVANGKSGAVRISGRTPVPMIFAPMLGITSVDVRASATVQGQRPRPNLVGLNRVSMASAAKIDSYDSAVGPEATGAGRVDVASNGEVTVVSSARLNGNVWHGPGYQATGTINGNTYVLSEPLVFPPADPEGHGPTHNDNARIPAEYLVGDDLTVGKSSTLDLPAGTYFVNDFEINASSKLRVQGPTVVYVTGNVRFHAASRTSQHRPADLQIRVIGNGTVDVECGQEADVYGVIYAPESSVRIDSNSSLYGTVIAGELILRSGGAIHYDETLPAGQINSIGLVD